MFSILAFLDPRISPAKGLRHLSYVSLGLGIGFLAATVLDRTRRAGPSRRDKMAQNHAAAFRTSETDNSNREQTRHAGPDSMRDRPASWGRVDEASDASFPASDPPPVSPGIA